MSIDLCAVFEGSRFNWTRALKFHDTLYHAFACDNQSSTLFHDATDDHPYVEYVYRAGYNPQGLEDYLQTLAKEEGHVESKFFTTHPSTTLRISKIDTLLKEYSDIKNLPFLAERFHQYVKAG